MALIDLNALLVELNAANAVENTNLKGYHDILTFTSLSDASRNIVIGAQKESQLRATKLVATIEAVSALMSSGYPAVTYPSIDPANIAQINAEIDTEVSGIHKVMKKLGSTV
jgi:23S rRNA A2030 N6-methylase RlmJ